MRLNCPFCGPRDEAEFDYGGDAEQRLLPPAGQEAGWLDALYLRANPRGPHAELWFHGFGCQRWLRVVRDTASHEVLEVGFAPAASPALASASHEVAP